MSPEPTWSAYLLVAVGGALGSVVRHFAGRAWDSRGQLPTGTVAVNLLGSGLLGVASGASLGGGLAALAAVGFCGALTTYSSFAVQSRERGARMGTLTVLVTLVPSVALYAVGTAVGALLIA